MTLILELPSAVEEAVSIEAQRRGLTPEQMLADDLERQYVKIRPNSAGADSHGDDMPKTGAELLAIMEREGLFLSREGQPDSPELARQIREKAWRRS